MQNQFSLNNQGPLIDHQLCEFVNVSLQEFKLVNFNEAGANSTKTSF